MRTRESRLIEEIDSDYPAAEMEALYFTEPEFQQEFKQGIFFSWAMKMMKKIQKSLCLSATRKQS